MRVVDLTHVISEGMPVYPGTEAPTFVGANTYSEDGFKETRISLHSHTGTHVDPPAHIIEGGMTLDEFSADAFVGRGIVIDCRELPDGAYIGMDILSRYSDEISRCDFILFATGWDERWGTDAYFGEYPVLSEDVLDFIISGNFKGIGFDVIGLDPIADANLSRHNKLFLARNVINVENLRGLDELIDKSFTFCCLPLKVKDSDGAPARAIAILDED